VGIYCCVGLLIPFGAGLNQFAYDAYADFLWGFRTDVRPDGGMYPLEVTGREALHLKLTEDPIRLRRLPIIPTYRAFVFKACSSTVLSWR